MLIYCCVAIIANVMAIILFRNNINITTLSAVPLLLIVLMIFQAVMLNHDTVENGFRTAYGSNLSAEEENKMYRNGSRFLFAAIPGMIPFIVFFSSPVKLLSVIVYAIGLTGGLVMYKMKNKGQIVSRMKSEEQERREQEKKEQLGRWK